MADAINACLKKDGGNTATADIPMGTNKFTGVGNATARTHYAAAGQVQDNSFKYASAGGTADALTLTLSPAPTAYATGMVIWFKATATNTGSATINVNSIGAKTFKKGAAAGTNLAAGDITSGGCYFAVYDGTNFHLLNPGFIATADIPNDTVTYAKIQNVVANQRVLGRTSGADGDVEELTANQVLSFIGSTQGQILYRDGSGWTVLAPGTSGQYLKTLGAAANPQWATITANRVYAEYATNADLSTGIPSDNTVPQNTEGDEILSVSITPTSATNRIRIRFNGHCARDGSGTTCTAAMFKSGTASAIQVTAHRGSASQLHQLSMEYEEVAGGTSAITYSIRAGADVGNMRFNGTNTGRLYGGAAKATLIAEEIVV